MRMLRHMYRQRSNDVTPTTYSISAACCKQVFAKSWEVCNTIAMSYPAKTARNNRIMVLRERGMSYPAIANQLREEGHDPVTAERVRQVVLRTQRSLRRLQKLNKEAGL